MTMEKPNEPKPVPKKKRKPRKKKEVPKVPKGIVINVGGQGGKARLKKEAGPRFGGGRIQQPYQKQPVQQAPAPAKPAPPAKPATTQAQSNTLLTAAIAAMLKPQADKRIWNPTTDKLNLDAADKYMMLMDKSKTIEDNRKNAAKAKYYLFHDNRELLKKKLTPDEFRKEEVKVMKEAYPGYLAPDRFGASDSDQDYWGRMTGPEKDAAFKAGEEMVKDEAEHFRNMERWQGEQGGQSPFVVRRNEAQGYSGDEESSGDASFSAPPLRADPAPEVATSLPDEFRETPRFTADDDNPVREADLQVPDGTVDLEGATVMYSHGEGLNDPTEDPTVMYSRGEDPAGMGDLGSPIPPTTPQVARTQEDEFETPGSVQINNAGYRKTLQELDSSSSIDMLDIGNESDWTDSKLREIAKNRLRRLNELEDFYDDPIRSKIDTERNKAKAARYREMATELMEDPTKAVNPVFATGLRKAITSQKAKYRKEGGDPAISTEESADPQKRARANLSKRITQAKKNPNMSI